MTWIRFPDGGTMAGEFEGALRPGMIITIDTAQYVVEDVGQIAAEQLPKSRRHGKARRFVPVAYLKRRVRGGPPEDAAQEIDISDARRRNGASHMSSRNGASHATPLNA